MDDLLAVRQKAEIINGEIIIVPPTGGAPGFAGDEVAFALRQHARNTGVGIAVGDNKGFRVNLPNRSSFSPDAAFFVGSDPGMRFYDGAPVFAVEVRSENDYGPQAEADMAQKRADYFAAGTLVVWDVDLLSDEPIKSYRAADPATPLRFRRGEEAHAEPALTGWKFPVSDLFR